MDRLGNTWLSSGGVDFKIVDKNPKDNSNWTPLHKAAGNGHVEVCKLILEKVEDKNPHALNGRTPLHVAAGEGHFEVIKNELIDTNFHQRKFS